MNGPWAIMLRFMLASYPFIIAWAIWVTKSMYELKAFSNSGARFSLQDAYSMERRTEDKIDRVEHLLREFEREFSSEFVRKDELPKTVD